MNDFQSTHSGQGLLKNFYQASPLTQFSTQNNMNPLRMALKMRRKRMKKDLLDQDYLTDTEEQTGGQNARMAY